MSFKTVYIKILQGLGRSALFSLHLGCYTHCLFEYGAHVVECSGPSMEPTIYNDDYVLCEHLSPLVRQIQNDDIVIAKSISNPNANVCKRVMGIAGDIVWSGESFIRIPQGHVWLEGDNELESFDSRMYGAVPEALIRGRVSFRIWPPEHICLF